MLCQNCSWFILNCMYVCVYIEFHGLKLDLHHMPLLLLILFLALFRHVAKIHPKCIDLEYWKRKKIQSKHPYVRWNLLKSQCRQKIWLETELDLPTVWTKPSCLCFLCPSSLWLLIHAFVSISCCRSSSLWSHYYTWVLMAFSPSHQNHFNCSGCFTPHIMKRSST